MLRYRQATLDDLDALLELERDFPTDRLTRRSLRRLLHSRSAAIWVCDIGTNVVGNAVVLYRAGTHSARLYSLAVDSSMRGRGIASRLLDKIETAATQRDCERVHLEVRCDNEPAIKFYLKHGYRTVRRINGFYEDGQDALRFERTLGDNIKNTAPANLAA